MDRIIVTGAGGFIGHHLVKRLKAEGHYVIGVDRKQPEYEATAADEFNVVDLRRWHNALSVFQSSGRIDKVFHLAADMGGIGFISANRATIARNNLLINLNTIMAAQECRVGKYLYSSSACVYNQDLQRTESIVPLKESDAWPALPEEGYGLEKLVGEKLCEYHREEFGMNTYSVRFHNVYGPLGTYDGGREKAPAAACRKVAEACDDGVIDIWGDGEQTRTFMYIDDCVEGLIQLIASDHHDPINLGSDEVVTINQLFNIVSEIAGKKLQYRHDLTKPQGVRGRTSDNSLLARTLGWEPSVKLVDGLIPTYAWIAHQLK